jgi:hypothetical protein
MTETQERFLRTVLTRVPLESVVELHLFPPIRRGTLETGVAVIATEMPSAQLAVLAEIDAHDASDDAVADAPSASARMRILTASYRHTIKGIERGKWIVEVQEEADAPLEAVEAVLRGVRQRSTEPADPELVSYHALEALLDTSGIAPAA